MDGPTRFTTPSFSQRTQEHQKLPHFKNAFATLIIQCENPVAHPFNFIIFRQRGEAADEAVLNELHYIILFNYIR